MAYSRSDLDSLMKQLVKLADVTPEDRIKFGKLLVIAIALLLITPIHATAEVIGLGHLPGSRSNGAFGISADGSVAAGADSADKQAVRRILASGKRPASGNRQ